MVTILFVCTGNTCRSPMAAAIANKVFCTQGIAASAVSCGVYAQNGFAASSNAVQAMKSYDLSITEHQSKKITKKAVESAHIVVTMTKNHKILILSEYKRHADKIFTLAELCDDKDIGDPFGGDETMYLNCAAQIKNCIEKLNWEALL